MTHTEIKRLACLPALLVIALALSACATIGERQSYSLDELYAATVADVADLRYFPRSTTDLQAELGWRQENPPPVRQRFDILALSSGGPDGAFGAGALKGLTEAGRRRDYEIVTGISTGALIAPFAFVGTQNDPILEQIYTGSDLQRVLGRPSVLAAASGPALYPARRVPEFMNRFVDERLLAEIAAEHAKGRRLLIATANLDASRLVIWNMGRIAQLGAPAGLDLFRSVLRAAIAIPGALPPVEIVSRVGDREIRELHGDAGVNAYFYAYPDLVPETEIHRRGKETARIDIILHNQIDAPPEPVQPRSIQLAGKSVSSLTRTSMRLLLNDTIEDAQAKGIELRYAHIPTDWESATSLEFDQAYMRRTFHRGYSEAKLGKLWKTGQISD